MGSKTTSDSKATQSRLQYDQKGTALPAPRTTSSLQFNALEASAALVVAVALPGRTETALCGLRVGGGL